MGDGALVSQVRSLAVRDLIVQSYIQGESETVSNAVIWREGMIGPLIRRDWERRDGWRRRRRKSKRAMLARDIRSKQTHQEMKEGRAKAVDEGAKGGKEGGTGNDIYSPEMNMLRTIELVKGNDDNLTRSVVTYWEK